MKSYLKYMWVGPLLAIAILYWQNPKAIRPLTKALHSAYLPVYSYYLRTQSSVNQFVANLKAEFMRKDRMQKLQSRQAKRAKDRNQKSRLQRQVAAKAKRARSRGFIDLRPYKEKLGGKPGVITSPYEQTRHAFLVTHLGMSDREADAFEYVNRRFADRISKIVMNRDPAGLDSNSLERIVTINDQRDDWLKRRLGHSKYHLFLEFEEREFFRNGTGTADNYSHNL